MTSRIVVIDYGMGNLHSVASALEHVAPEAEVIVSADPALVKSAVLAPRCSRSALVPRVVANRIDISGRASSNRFPVSRRTAKVGGSSGDWNEQSSPKSRVGKSESTSTIPSAADQPTIRIASLSVPCNRRV